MKRVEGHLGGTVCRGAGQPAWRGGGGDACGIPPAPSTQMLSEGVGQFTGLQIKPRNPIFIDLMAG